MPVPSLSGDTTPCKVTPVILHGIVSPGTLPCTSGCKPCLDALHSHPLRQRGWECHSLSFAHPSFSLHTPPLSLEERMGVQGRGWLSSLHRTPTVAGPGDLPPTLSTTSPYTLNNLTSRSNENHYKLGHGSKSKAFVWFLVSPDSEEKCATAPPPLRPPYSPRHSPTVGS